jgi:hypothetical protein
MTKVDLKYRIEVEQAFLDGKKIQVQDDSNKTWYDTENPSFSWFLMSYRIKPESKTVPYSFEELCEAIKIHGNGLLINNNEVIFIADFCKNTAYSGGIEITFSKDITDREGYTYKVVSVYALCNKKFKFIDGTLVGKVIEE